MNTNKITMFGNLSGKGKLKLADTTTVLFDSHGIEGAIELDIIEDDDDTSSYLSVISAQAQTQDELYLSEELTGYTTEFAESISYWKFYKGDNAIQSAADCVYLHATYGDDSNSGDIKAPVKTIEQASNIIKNNVIPNIYRINAGGKLCPISLQSDRYRRQLLHMFCPTELLQEMVICPSHGEEPPTGCISILEKTISGTETEILKMASKAEFRPLDSSKFFSHILLMLPIMWNRIWTGLF